VLHANVTLCESSFILNCFDFFLFLTSFLSRFCVEILKIYNTSKQASLVRPWREKAGVSAQNKDFSKMFTLSVIQMIFIITCREKELL
jgi:hypothetical protein